MSRTSYFAILLSTALLAGPLAAQKDATIEHVVVRGTPDAMEVEIQTSGAPVSPNTQVVTGPDRIVVDFPGAHPSAQLRALTVNRGALKSIRSGLFFNNPPITRIVLDLSEAQQYHISTDGNAVVVKLGAASAARKEPPMPAVPVAAQLRQTALVKETVNAPVVRNAVAPIGSFATISIAREPVRPAPVTNVFPDEKPPSAGAASKRAVLATKRINSPFTPAIAPKADAVAMNAPAPIVIPAINPPAANSAAVNAAVSGNAPELPAEPPKPLVNVSYVNGMLSIHAEHATLAQVLFEVQKQTQAEIAIPSGAEQEQVVLQLGPGSARDVLGALLNGSPYNFIFVGNEHSLERVILTRRDPSIF
jgi:hypothetical protein